ncbi:hypothetical protein KA977_06450 [Candidatus Dependentiae bacterium]|nr:hypothetical protein [Candidatus Dependentiae bacterium]
MNNRLLFNLFLILFIISNAEITFSSDETVIHHKTIHSFNVNSFIIPAEKEFNSNIDIFKKNIVGRILKIIQNSDIVSIPYLNILPAVTEPLFNIPKYINIYKELKNINFNNIKLTVILKEQSVPEKKITLKLYKNLNNVMTEIYSEELSSTLIHSDLVYTLKSGIFKFQLLFNEIVIGSSETFELTDFDDKKIKIETFQSKLLKLKLLCNDGKSPLNEASVALKYKTGGIFETGKTNSSGIIVWNSSKKEDLKIPISADNDYFFNLEIINQRQKIKTEKIVFSEEIIKKQILNIITDQHPRNYFLDKKIKLKGKISGDFIVKNLPVPYIKITFYEKEVGFLDLYGNDAGFLKIGECKSFSDGSFELENIDVDDGPNQSTRDIIVSAELESDYLIMYNAMLGTKTIYRYKIDLQENIWPYNSEYDFGEISLSSLNSEKPLALYQIMQNQLINFKNENPIFNRTIFTVYPATKIYMDVSEDIKYFYSDNILKITKKGGDYILKYGLTSDNINDLLKEAANSKNQK